MSVPLGDYGATVAPTPHDVELAKESQRRLALLKKPTRSRITVSVQTDGTEESVSIPLAAYNVLAGILEQMALGNAVTIIPVHAELTTQEAADILNVSRPFVIKLVDDWVLPCKKVGSHRRIPFRDLMDYKKASDVKSSKALEELSAQAQELDMGY